MGKDWFSNLNALLASIQSAHDALDAEHVANAVAAGLRLHKLDHRVVALVLVGLNACRWQSIGLA